MFAGISCVHACPFAHVGVLASWAEKWWPHTLCWGQRPVNICTFPSLSLDDNELTGSIFSPDMSGILKLAEVLPNTQLTSLR